MEKRFKTGVLLFCWEMYISKLNRVLSTCYVLWIRVEISIASVMLVRQKPLESEMGLKPSRMMSRENALNFTRKQ